MEESDSKRNILNKENGFNTRVNLFIIRYLYYHMKKASIFMKEGTKKRQASVDLKEYTLISRQRFARIFQGSNFEITALESKTIAERFNISKEYFKKDSELIPIYGITQDDWKCYFYESYGKGASVSLHKPSNETNAGMENVKDYLKKIIKKKYIIEHYDTSSPVYRIYYFFENGVTYRDTNTLDKLLENLELLKISAWKELATDPDKMKKYFNLLEKHYEYVKAYLKCQELEKAD